MNSDLLKVADDIIRLLGIGNLKIVVNYTSYSINITTSSNKLEIIILASLVLSLVLFIILLVIR